MQHFALPSTATETTAAAFLSENDPALRSVVFSSLDQLREGDLTTPPVLSWAELELYRARISSPARIRSVFPILLDRHQAIKDRTMCVSSDRHGNPAPPLLQIAQLAFDAINLALMAHALLLTFKEIELRTEHFQLHNAATEAFWNPKTATYTDSNAIPWLLLARIATPERALLLFPENAFPVPSPLPPLDDCLALLKGLDAFCFRKQTAAFSEQLRSFLQSPDSVAERSRFPYSAAAILQHASTSTGASPA